MRISYSLLLHSSYHLDDKRALLLIRTIAHSESCRASPAGVETCHVFTLEHHDHISPKHIYAHAARKPHCTGNRMLHHCCWCNEKRKPRMIKPSQKGVLRPVSPTVLAPKSYHPCCLLRSSSSLAGPIAPKSGKILRFLKSFMLIPAIIPLVRARRHSQTTEDPYKTVGGVGRRYRAYEIINISC